MASVDSFASRPGWSAWKGINVNVHQAGVCTPTHAFASTIGNVPGAGPDDALEMILAVMK
ncbi:hypothetical protein TV39_08880 [Arthrobacter sp. SPG23]|nr:hypothetical protein TV39_08880 [Arthrobacter sp. SPG23]